jgi:Ser/Thr protein kinase RdoA (MazF antagonist)
MMKLKHLFNNTDLALMLLKNWEYDEASLELFKHYRISANAIYPYKWNGEICFLRFCPITEKRIKNITAELEFIGYLRGKGYPALEPVPSKTGKTMIQTCTPWGEYYTCVFKRVQGTAISTTGFEDPALFAYGQTLGELHRLSRGYTHPKTQRWTHTHVLDWIEETLQGMTGQETALDESVLLRKHFATLPIHPASYGLIHYDFETDNVFYDPATHSCAVIDFDDAMYHWYGMDIERALNSLESELSGREFEQKKTVFLEGYQSRSELDPVWIDRMPVFKRFASLYQYARITRSIQEKWDNEPEWMGNLRARLENLLLERVAGFRAPFAAGADWQE